MNDTLISKAQDVISHPAVAVGAPTTGGAVGIVAMCEQLAPVLTVVSIMVGITLGILSYRLKRKLILKQLEEENGPHKIND